MTKIVIPILLMISIHIQLFSLSKFPKREFRGAWIATVANIDWPSSRTATSSEQKEELIEMLEQLRSAGINAVLFQVRTECDALYNSQIEPWSYWLTGKQGSSPHPLFDPLDFAIQEAHKRGMELHAWLNPYRAVKTVGEYQVSESHISQTHPEWILTFDKYKMLDPGLPDVRNYIVSVVEDIITRYDVDGIHFDDYFYPYSPKISNEDSLSFKYFNNGFEDIDDWRRYNINKMVELVHNKINEHKPHIKFGISPFGIVENKYAGTSGFNSYSILYCDPLTWIREKTIDYLTPQIYWEIGHPKADYSKLLPWWASVVEDRHLYVGHYSSRFTAKRYEGKKSEIGDQLRINRSFKNIYGSVFFSAKSISNNSSGFADTLKNNFYTYHALIPLMAWKDSIPPNAPKEFNARKSPGLVKLTWMKSEIALDDDEAKYYLLYKFKSDDNIDFENPENIFKVLPGSITDYEYQLENESDTEIIFGISALDKLQNESSNNPILLIK